MKKIYTKAAPWMVVSLLAATSAFGQSKQAPNNCSKPCVQTIQDPMPAPTVAAYNAPAGIDTNCGWDVFFDATFLYWQPILENLELGFVNSSADSYGKIFNMDFSYKPGFQIAAGYQFDYDNWNCWAQYTRFHGVHTQHASVGPASNIAPMVLAPFLVGSNLSSMHRKWRLNMDIVDLLLGREYYVGTKLAFNTYFGARGAWIRQTLTDSYTGPGGSGGLGGISVHTDAAAFGGPSTLSFNGASHQSTHSWAVGPRAGLDASWLIGQGLRMIGNGGGDILYTRYTRLRNNSSVTQVVDNVGVIETTTTALRVQEKNAGYLRVHLDLEMGLGWGSYFSSNNWHFDVNATYGFQAFFNQNMFRQFVDSSSSGTSINPDGDLFVHGLNLTARFDF